MASDSSAELVLSMQQLSKVLDSILNGRKTSLPIGPSPSQPISDSLLATLLNFIIPSVPVRLRCTPHLVRALFVAPTMRQDCIWRSTVGVDEFVDLQGVRVDEFHA
jgi:hypothetical protein